MPKPRPWTEKEITSLRLQYPNTPTQALAKSFRRSLSAIYGRAGIMGLHKSADYLAGPDACRLRRGDYVGTNARFQAGHVPANKGLRRPGYAPGRMSQTQFRKGSKPHTWKPIGTTRFSKDGYLQQKVSDTGYPPRDWVGGHILTWEKANGTVPKGHAIAFKDRNRANTSLDNLELISRRELMLRNTIHKYPAELVEVIRLGAKLKRTLRRIDEEQDRGPAQSSL